MQPWLKLAAAAAFVSTAVPAAAQDEPMDPRTDRRWTRCSNETGELSVDDAIRACSRLIGMRRLSAEHRSLAYYNRGTHYYGRGDYPRALADLNRALADNPNYSWAYSNRANVYLEMGHFERARADYDEAIRREPDSFAYNARAVYHERRYDFAAALADSREAVRLSPEDPNLLNVLCWHLGLANRDLDEALRSCERSLELRPGDAATLDSRGMVALRQGRHQDAWNDYDAAYRADTTLAPALYGRGIAAIRLGREAEGRADLAAAAALDAGLAELYARYGVTP